MGKVASSSVYEDLRFRDEVNAYKIHRMNPDAIASVREEYLRLGAPPPNEELGLYLYREISQKKRKAKIISMVREPISRNVSAYFENLDTYEAMKSAHTRIKIDELVNNFLKKYNHDLPLTWFDIEMRSTTGIDVFEHEFPQQQGHHRIISPPFELLLMRHDLDNAVKEDLIQSFLNIRDLTLSKVNVGVSKKYAEVYDTFLHSIQLPEEYIERMLDSRYAAHFFPKEELDQVRNRWSGGDSL
jgi:hypothetical protein